MTLDELIRAAHHNIPEAQYVVALCFENGWGVTADTSVAKGWVLKSAKQGHAAAQYELALLLQAKSEILVIESVDWLLKSANQGFSPAEYLYSLYCEGGIGMAADPVEAFRYCLRAAENGYCPAARRVASMLEQGIGVAENLKQAFHWYRRAAELGDADSATSVGRMYAGGVGVDKNDAMAMDWYSEGKKRGSPWALYALSSVYRFGELSQSVDLNRAAELAEQAVKLIKERADRGSVAEKTRTPT